MATAATRVLALLELLQDRGVVGGPELARRLGVDARTVRRDVARLVALGIPVDAERGRHGGYRLRPGYRMPPLMLTDEEATAVVLGLVAARQAGLASTGSAVEGALAKVRRVLPVALGERARALEEAFGFAPEVRRPTAPDADVLLALAEAVRRRRRVRVQYEAADGTASDRELDPYGLVANRGRWYLAAHDHLRGELRTFRVDRVRSAEPLREAAPLPEGFDAVQHVVRSLATAPWRWEVEVLLETEPETARARISPTMGALEPVAGGVVLRCGAERLDGMAQMLAGLGWRFEVRRPAELREAVRELAASLAADAERQPAASA